MNQIALNGGAGIGLTSMKIGAILKESTDLLNEGLNILKYLPATEKHLNTLNGPRHFMSIHILLENQFALSLSCN